MQSVIEFDRATLPWLDRHTTAIDAYVDGLGDATPQDYDLRWMLRHWVQFGYVAFPAAIDPVVIDAYLADVDEILATREKFGMRVTAQHYGTRRIGDLPPDAFEEPHFRLMDAHNPSVAGKMLALAPRVVSFLSHVFRDTPVAMQSLTFKYGSEQATHQDFPYVVSGVTSHLAASWIALEDVHPDAGPLGYFPGSHTIRKFDWEDGLHYHPGVKKNPDHFKVHLEEECRKAGLEQKTFCAKKGDVFIWHAALAHSGRPVNTPGITRKSFVTHFSTKQAYTFDRRAPQQPPVKFALNGGLVFGDPIAPQDENVLARGGAVPPIVP